MTKDEFIEKVRYFTSVDFLAEMQEVGLKTGSPNPDFFADSVALCAIIGELSKLEG